MTSSCTRLRAVPERAALVGHSLEVGLLLEAAKCAGPATQWGMQTCEATMVVALLLSSGGGPPSLHSRGCNYHEGADSGSGGRCAALPICSL